MANDSDVDRAFTLTYQCQRTSAPQLVVTHHNAVAFPNLNLDPTAPAPSDLLPRLAALRAEVGAFDKVLADVPCSGDGTLR